MSATISIDLRPSRTRRKVEGECNSMREVRRPHSGVEWNRNGAEGILTVLVCVCVVERKSTMESLSFMNTPKCSPLERVTASATLALHRSGNSIVEYHVNNKRKRSLIDALSSPESQLACACFIYLRIRTLDSCSYRSADKYQDPS